MRVDICITTCRRPNGLARLLGALQQLRLPEPPCALRVVVVDNDETESARAVCRDAASWLSHPLLYVSEKRRGIPQARNAALAASVPHADFLALIDDDEVPDASWLVELLEAQYAHAADAVTGPVDPAFEHPVPEWLEASGLFAGRCHDTGARLDSAFSHNTLVATRALEAMERWFDERLALTGSSDTEFFERFAAEGHRIVWCESARVREWVPASRARVGWLLRRAFRTGSMRTRIERMHGAAGRELFRIGAHGCWCIAKGMALASLGLRRGRAGALRGLALSCSGAGRLAGLTGWAYLEYRTVHGV